MLNKLDDYPDPSDAGTDRTCRNERPQRLRPHLVQRLLADGSYYFGIGMAVYPHRGILDCAFSVVQRGCGNTVFTVRGAHRSNAPTCRWVRSASKSSNRCCARACARRQQERHRVRPDVLGAHGRDPGSAADIVVRHAARHGRDALRSVRALVRLVKHPDGKIKVDDPCATARRIARGACAVSANRSAAARRSRMPSAFFLWAPLFWDDHITHAIFFDGPNGEALCAKASSHRSIRTKRQSAGVRRATTNVWPPRAIAFSTTAAPVWPHRPRSTSCISRATCARSRWNRFSNSR